MSIKVMTAVFDRYPNGGGEMLLALGLADHASDDGSRIFPSIKHLAEKTRQGERSVQYQLRRMEESGWLILVNAGNGGRNQHREYQISPNWIKGADIAPPLKGATDDRKGATDDTKGCNPQHKTVQPVAPAYNHQVTVIEPSEKGKRASPPLFDVPDLLLADYLSLRKAKKAGPLTPTVIAGLQREADKASLTLTQAVTACCEFGWQGFNAGWYAGRTTGVTAANSETPYQRSMRLRVAEVSPLLARAAPGDTPKPNPTDFFRNVEPATDVEVIDVKAIEVSK